MKSFICVFVFVTMVAFVGCATTGGGAGGSAGGSKSKLSEADFKRMGVSETYDQRK